jgi:dephospho-CoA kinase
MVLRIGLTGNIGSGKSTVAKFFAELGSEIFDADVIVHEILATNSEIQQKILEHFGNGVLLKNNTINRKYLREQIFKNATERSWLENLLHPKIFAIMAKRAKKTKSPYCVLVIPLLFETKAFSAVDRILVVEAEESVQINRAMARDKNTKEQITAILKTQVDSATAHTKADDIITNNGTLDDLKQKVLILHKKYLALATRYQ